MADTKLTALSEVSAPALSDIMYWVADPAGTPASNKISATRLGGLLSPLYTTGRLTLATGNAAPVADQIDKSTLYYTSLTNDGTVTTNPLQVVLYDGSRLRLYSNAQVSLSLTLTDAKNYDVFLYDNSGTLTMELSAAWTNGTTRADALAAQSGIIVKSGAATRRWIGTIRSSGTDKTEDSGGGFTSQVGGKRFVYNAYNQVPRLLAVADDTPSWDYTGATIRQAGGAAGNKVELVQGRASESLFARLVCIIQSDNNSSQAASAGIGLDSITAYATSADGLTFTRSTIYNTSAFLTQAPLTASLSGNIGLGYHYLSWLEAGADGTSTFIGGLSISGLVCQVLM